MLKTVHCAIGLGILLVACTAGVASTSSSSSGSTTPQVQAEITAPSGVHITASIAAATLGEQCGGSGGGFAPSQGDCAPVDAGSSGGAGKGVGGGCGGSYCQQSNVQLAFTTGAGSKGATVEIVRVELLDSSGAVVDTLTSSKPQAWNGQGYSAWDQILKPASDAKTSYDLSAPAWSKLDSKGVASSSYSAKYKLHVTMRIDGVEIVLESTDLSREPAVVT